MPGFHRHGNRFYRRGGSFRGAGWLIGIGVLMMFGGHLWPVILIFIGISLVLGAFWKEAESEEVEQAPFRPAPPPMRPPALPVEFNQAPPRPAEPARPVQRIELLPANCPRCGAPVRSPAVLWKGERFAACAYCGSNMLTKNAS